MGRVKLILGLALLALAFYAVWQIGWSEWANASLQDDMVDLASQAGTHIGMRAQHTDDDLRTAVIRKADSYGIQLDPQQVTVQSNPDTRTYYLAADYDVRVNLVISTYTLHFTPSSRR